MLRINFVRITVSILYISQKHFHEIHLLIDALIMKETNSNPMNPKDSNIYSPKIHQPLSPTSKGSHVENKFRQNYHIHFIYRPETFSWIKFIDREINQERKRIQIPMNPKDSNIYSPKIHQILSPTSKRSNVWNNFY